MVLPIVLVGLALFVLAFLGVNRFVPMLVGLAAVLGLIFGLYLVWQAFGGSDETAFFWGCLLLLASGAVLVYIKSAFSD